MFPRSGYRISARNKTETPFKDKSDKSNKKIIKSDLTLKVIPLLVIPHQSLQFYNMVGELTWFCVYSQMLRIARVATDFSFLQ